MHYCLMHIVRYIPGIAVVLAFLNGKQRDTLHLP